MDPEKAWQAALGELQLQMTKATFDTWVKNTYLVAYEDGVFIIGVHTSYAAEWLENRLQFLIKRTLGRIIGRTVGVRFIVRLPRPPKEDIPELLSSPVPEVPSTDNDRCHSNLDGRYTFETFIVGNSNRLAHAASVAIAERPAEAYNPFFIYGGVGLGKTHLLHAIGHILQRNGRQVLYVTSEKFTNDLIEAIRCQTTGQFRSIYREIDVLLVDDIEFIAGKESTQEEFFHTFNALYAAGRQIVLSSDRPPKAILTLEERLRSRFEWGLIADIQPPDLETRIAILRSKAENYPFSVPDDVIFLIAQRVQSNIRELEGALNRLVACVQLTSAQLTPEVAASLLDNVVFPHRCFTPTEIVDEVAHFYNLEPADLRSKRRTKKVVLPRQIVMYLAREMTDASLPQIGQELGGRDHSTIMYGHDKIADQLEKDEQLRQQLLAIKERIHNHK
ncbi:MAG: chromosomal replication initiator protein DnaA [Anaerolineae bacterium]